MTDLALQVPRLFHYQHINNTPKGPQILNFNLSHFENNPHCLSSSSSTSDILYTPHSTSQMQFSASLSLIAQALERAPLPAPPHSTSTYSRPDPGPASSQTPA